MKINNDFINEISKYFKTSTELKNFLDCCQKPLKKSIKINLSKIDFQSFSKLTKRLGFSLTDSGITKDNLDLYYIDRDNIKIALGNTFLHQSGFFYIQELAAGMPAKLINFNKDENIVLDMCAAPGGKTIQLNDYLLKSGTEGFVIANDFDYTRLKALGYNIQRMGAFNTGITNINGFNFGKNLNNFFDHVLLDAPCSGEGTGFKSDSALSFWRIEEINKICGIQQNLLISAINCCKPGGTIIYSTCTLNYYENEQNINKALDLFGNCIEIENIEISKKQNGIYQYGDKEIINPQIAKKCARFRPHIHGTGGFFVCKIRKNDYTGKKFNNKNNQIKPINKNKLNYHKSLQTQITNYLKETFGILVNPEIHLFLSDNKFVYLSSPKYLELKDILSFQKIGIPIIKLNRDKSFRPLHFLASILGNLAKKNYAILETQQAQNYSENNDINIQDIKIINKDINNKYVLLKRENYGISMGKIVDGNIKNMYLK